MLALALGARFHVHASPRNYNTEIGVPKTLFDLDGTHQVAVLEMAMRGKGEIERLAEIARPTIGVITNIGLSHIERLGSRDNIAAAKAELLGALDTDGIAVINSDDDYCDYLIENCHSQVVTYGVTRPSNFQAADIEYSSRGCPSFTINGQRFVMTTPGSHHVINSAAVCAVASVLGVSLAEVAERIHSFASPPQRGEAVQLADGTIILNDTYNAAPDSMRSALETLAIIASGRRSVAVLGDMNELGEYSSAAHSYVGKVVKDQNIQLLVTVGEAAWGIGDAASPQVQQHAFADTTSAASGLAALLRPGDVVLIKGSRTMEMERIVQALLEAIGPKIR